jgi:UDP-N-acetylmuramoyl-tripeptide--D-alanyl-D-alanine ligase
MIALTLKEVASAVAGEIVVGNPDSVVSGIVDTDSRNLGKGDVFFAKLGEQDDGHRYLASVASQGASLAIVSEPNPAVAIDQIRVSDTVIALSLLAKYVLERVRSAGNLQVVGITGSNGKTSTKNMLLNILSTVDKTIAPRDSFNNEVGLPITVLRLEEDTRFLVLEMGAAGPGSIAALASWCQPDIGIQLKVGLAHAGAFGSIEITAQIKQELMPHIRSIAILNEDDPVVSEFPVPAGVKRVGFGFSRGAEFEIRNVEVSLQGTKVVLRYPNGDEHIVTMKILGEHQAMNLAAAMAAADSLGVDPQSAIAAVESMDMAERWRMQLIRRTDGVYVINDAYNASPDSMRAGLQTLATIGRQGHRTVAVLGQMAELGDYAMQEHDQVGRLVVRYNIDQLFVVGSQAKLIHMGASQEGSWDGESVFCETISEAFEAINDKLLPGDVVLVKSSNVAGLRFLGDELAGVK